MKTDRIDQLERRLATLEARLNSAPSKRTAKGSPAKATEKMIADDIDELMQKHSKSFSKGIIFTALAIPSENPNRFVRWSGCGGFKNDSEVDRFMDAASEDVTARFCSNFSSPERLRIIKAFVKHGPLGQKEILDLTGVSQGQFYHHIKDLVASRLVEKQKKDSYDLSAMGHVLTMSFLGIINAFVK